jgi:hypothetical protein
LEAWARISEAKPSKNAGELMKTSFADEVRTHERHLQADVGSD